MGHRCCTKQKVKRGLWSPEEDEKLLKYITTHGHGSWSSVPKLAGLQRCGKSCRLRWINYLRPDLKRGSFSAQEEQIIIDVHRILGNRWAQIAKHLPGRTDNEVKNFWNSFIKKKLISQGLDPKTHNLIPSHKRTNKQSFSIINVNPPLPPSTNFTFNHTNSHDDSTINIPSFSSSGFSILEENCFWSPSNNDNNMNNNGVIVEPFEAQKMEVEQVQQNQEKKVDYESKSVQDQDLDGSFESSSFGLEFMESTLLSTSILCRELNCIDDFSWNF